uniref:putative toxin-antitoxin system toxin component, PIN family n=1 Tax=Indioceanicola profundi TaxID=2220096 RepID=UPI000E6AA35D|nr:putative toxin-antitoxin system toxin component, PIN family [Indioceanicola profundi]
MRVVIDTDVMVAALESASGASRALLLSILDGKAVLVCSTPLFFEYEAVLTRPQVLQRAGVTSVDVREFLDELASLCVPVGFDFRWRPVADDPDDDLVIETAVNGMADAIATFNIKDIRAGAENFGIIACRPVEVLRRITR